jgi:hypothetical protein
VFCWQFFIGEEYCGLKILIKVWKVKQHNEIGVFVKIDLKQCATTGCLISHEREELNAAKSILSSIVKNDQSHSREIRRKKS